MQADGYERIVRQAPQLRPIRLGRWGDLANETPICSPADGFPMRAATTPLPSQTSRLARYAHCYKSPVYFVTPHILSRLTSVPSTNAWPVNGPFGGITRQAAHTPSRSLWACAYEPVARKPKKVPMMSP
jgi:hypothetical protein